MNKNRSITLRQSPECLVKDGNRSKRSKTQQWAGKVEALVFLDAYRITVIDYLEKRKTTYRHGAVDELKSKNRKKTTAN